MLEEQSIKSFEQALESLQGKLASVDGQTAIFFSGDEGNNYTLADDCQKKYPDSTYTINQTEAGKLLHWSII